MGKQYEILLYTVKWPYGNASRQWIKLLGAVSLTYLSILKEGFTPIFSATLSYGKERFTIRKLGSKFRQAQTVHNFSHSVNMAAALNIIL